MDGTNQRSRSNENRKGEGVCSCTSRHDADDVVLLLLSIFRKEGGTVP
jgi:hypothetical protein